MRKRRSKRTSNRKPLAKPLDYNVVERVGDDLVNLGKQRLAVLVSYNNVPDATAVPSRFKSRPRRK